MIGLRRLFGRPVTAAGIGILSIGVLSLGLAGQPAAAAKLTLAVPGIPPVFAGVMPMVADQAGFYKKHGVEITIKPMNSGAAAAKAVFTGNVDMSLSPTAVVMKMVSNAGVSLVGIQGMENPDWLLGSMDPAITKCADFKGQGVGVDSPRGARWVQLSIMLLPCKMRPDKHVPTVNLSSNVGAAMVAGQLKLGVLHADDIPVIERESGKKVHIVSRVDDVRPGTHYLMLVVKRDTIAKKRDGLVRVLAAHIEALAFMRDPANAKTVAKMAKMTGRSPSDAEAALKVYNAMEFWPNGHVGLTRKKIDKTIAIQVSIGKRTKGKGGINPKKKAATYDGVTDASLWKEALARTK